MGTVSDLASARAARNRTQRPTRAPDLEVDVWFDRDPVDPDAIVDWMAFRATSGEWPPGRVWSAVVDAAWLCAKHDTTKDGKPADPVIWMFLDATGRLITLYPDSAITGTNWRHARWLVRWGCRMWMKSLRLAWLAGSAPWRERRAASK